MRSVRTEGGFTIVLVLFFILLLMGLGYGLVQEGLAAKTSVNLHATSLKALEMTEVGIIRAETEIRSLTDVDGNGTMGSVVGSLGDGTYEVEVRDDPASPERWILTATGIFRLSKRRVEVGVRRWQNAQGVEALFAMEDITVSNVATDAYDSRLGTYAGQATNVDAEGPYAQMGGNVGSNGNVYLDGTSVYVRGNAIAGPLGQTELQGNPTVLGDIAPRLVEWERDPAPESDFRAAMLSNDNDNIAPPGNGNTVRYNDRNMTLDIAGNTNIVLPGGTYFFSDINIRGGSTVTFDGPTKIYVTGTLEIGADSDFSAGAPADLSVFAHGYPLPNASGQDALVKVNGGSNITWSLYAPGADLDIGGGNHFFGAAVARNIELQGTNHFHYDKALGEVLVFGAARIERLFWRDLDPPRR